MKKFILASASPRRKQLLEESGYDFQIETSDKEGEIDAITPPDKFAIRCAINKAEDVFSRQDGEVVVLGADTIVCLNGKILGKPTDEKDAMQMLNSLSNNTHEVITGVCLKTSEYCKTFKVVTKVTFKEMSEEEIASYCELKTVYDKAGAYAIQNEAGQYISSIEGDYNNVVGFPVDELRKYLK